MALHEHAHLLASTTNIDKIVVHTMDAMEFSLGFEAATFSIVDSDRQALHLLEVRGMKASFSKLPLDGPGVTVKSARLRKTIRIPDTRKETTYVDNGGRTGKEAEPTQLSELTVPVLVDGETAAVLNVERSSIDAFTETDQRLLETLASHVAMALTGLRRDEALRSSEENLQALFNATTDAATLQDTDGTILAANEVLAKTVRMKPNQVIGACGYDLAPLDSAKPRKLKIDQVVRSGKSVRFEDERDGRWFDNSIYPVLDAHGRVTRLAIFARDITERKEAEDKLRKSAEEYRSLFDRILDGVYRSTHDGRFIDMNPAFVRMFGYSNREEMLKIPNISQALYFSPEERVRHTPETAGKWVERFPMKRKDGSMIWVEDHGNYVHDEHGNVTYHEGILRDVTERKQAEDALKRYSENLENLVQERTRKLASSEKRFRDFADLLPQIAFETDEKGNLTFLNRAGSSATGYNQDETNRLSALQLVIPEERDNTRRNIERILSGEKLPPHEYTARRKDGSTFPVIMDTAPLIREDKVVGTRGVAMDITELRRAEEALRTHMEQLALLDATVLEITKPHDLSKLLRTITERAVHLLGARTGSLYLCDEEHRTLRCAADYNHAEDHSGTVLKYGEGAAGIVAETGEPLIVADYATWTGRVAGYENESPSVTVLVVPLTWGDHVVGAIDISDDSHNRVFTQGDVKLLARFAAHSAIAVENARLTQRLLKAEHLAAIGETASMVGHDLRNPLQGIAGAVYLLRDDSLMAEERNEMLHLIENCLEYSDGIVKDLLDYARPFELARVDITPKEIVTQAMRAVQIPSGVNVEDLSEDQPTISADTDRIKRAFVNLIENALDAMPNGGTLTINSEKSDEHVEISISDTGAGMTKEAMENLWKPLHTTKAKGIGMGLATCKRIIDAHGGQVSVESKMGEGTTFTIRLPIKVKLATYARVD